MRNKQQTKCNHSPSKSDGRCRLCGVKVYTGFCGVCNQPWKECKCEFVATRGDD